MRIATANSYSASLDALVERQAGLTQAHQQLSTGKRVNLASDDPAAAARAERALAAEWLSIAKQRGVDGANTAMTLTESALGDATNLLQDVREALVASANPTFTDSDRKIVANQLSDLRSQLLSVANRADSAGSFLFGGQGANSAPFVDAPGGVQYLGTAGAAQAASGEPVPLTLDGAPTWMQARTGNGVFEATAQTSTGTAWIGSGGVTNPALLTGSTYSIQFTVAAGATPTTPTTTYSVLKDGVATAQTNQPFQSGQALQIDGMTATISGSPANADVFVLKPSTPTLSIFNMVDKAIADLSTPNLKPTARVQTSASNLSNLDQVLGGVVASRSQVGATMNRIDHVSERLSALKLASQTERSNAEDLDMTQAISAFTSKQTGYDAALKAYSMVQRLSLFNYVNP